MGAVQGPRFSGRCGARYRGASARIGSGFGDARPRHLDRGRHHTTAQADSGGAGAGGGFRAGKTGTAAAEREWWLGGRECFFLGTESAGRRLDQLLSEKAAYLRKN